MEKPLIEQLDAALADLRTRRDQAHARLHTIDQEAQAAQRAFDKACLVGTAKDRDQAEDAINTLARSRELAEREIAVLERSMRTGEGAPREIAYKIKEAREADLRALAQALRAKGGELEKAAQHFLDLVAALGRLYNSGGASSAAFTAAAPYLPPHEQTINSPLPTVDHATRKGAPYLIDAKVIENTFRNAFNAPRG